jgi:hypothetical protein
LRGARVAQPSDFDRIALRVNMGTSELRGRPVGDSECNNARNPTRGASC